MINVYVNLQMSQWFFFWLNLFLGDTFGFYPKSSSDQFGLFFIFYIHCWTFSIINKTERSMINPVLLTLFMLEKLKNFKRMVKMLRVPLQMLQS